MIELLGTNTGTGGQHYWHFGQTLLFTKSICNYYTEAEGCERTSSYDMALSMTYLPPLTGELILQGFAFVQCLAGSWYPKVRSSM